MLDQYYTFRHIRGGDKTLVTTTSVSWDEIADRFYEFLLACGFCLDKQDLADHFDQSCFSQDRTEYDRLGPGPQFAPETDTELDNHAARYGMELSPEGVSYGQPDKFANPPRPIYEFSVSDSGQSRLTLPSIWTLAQSSASERQDFEQNMDSPAWPPHRLVLTGCTVNDSSDGLRYLFEVWSI